jgi:hypothetical protein
MLTERKKLAIIKLPKTQAGYPEPRNALGKEALFEEEKT